MMVGSRFGYIFRVTTFGESHGPALGGIVEGCPPGLLLAVEDIQQELDRRRPGQAFTSPRAEPDQVEILSGVFEGQTTGTPIALLIRNQDARSEDYAALRDQFRPGHADYTYQHKYGIRDHRGGGRASARETVARVAAGAIAKKYLQTTLGMRIRGYVAQIGDICAKHLDWSAVATNPFSFPDAQLLPAIEQLFDDLQQQGDSIGAKITVVAESVPIGLGEPVFAKLDAALAGALMSIPAVKAVEIGEGIRVVQQRGSAHRDALTETGFASNHAGGILGGLSNGEPIEVSIALKPTSSIRQPIASLNNQHEAVTLSVPGRHDPCVGLRAVPIAEAMVALVLMDHYLWGKSLPPHHS